jgi:hypothetical protein
VCLAVGWADPAPEGLPESVQTGPTKGADSPACLQCTDSHLRWLEQHYIEYPPHGLSSVRAPGLQRSRACGGLWICGRTVCEGTAAVRDGGRARERTLYPSATAQLPNPQVRDGEKEGPYRAVGPPWLARLAGCRTGSALTHTLSMWGSGPSS